MWPRTSRDLNEGECDGRIWAKGYGDHVVPLITESQFADATAWAAITAACFAAAESETHRLRSTGRSDTYLEAWKSAATSAFVGRTKTLHILQRTNS